MLVRANHQPPTTNRLSAAVVVIAAVYLVAHLPFLAPSLEDIDSINFALGLRHFDPALHQPHPPGYPVYMLLGHISLPIIERLTSTTGATAEAQALAIWSAIGGAGCILAAWFLFLGLAERAQPHSLEAGSWRLGVDGRRTALWATLLLSASPLFWMTGLRPMSDMPGLALAIGAQALLLRRDSPEPRGSLIERRGPLIERRGPFGSAITGAFLAGVATGIRVQSAVLTVPVLGLVLFERRDQSLLKPIVAFLAGCLAWGIPLVIASGGISAYLAALHTQAGEDFSWVDMLWSQSDTAAYRHRPLPDARAAVGIDPAGACRRRGSGGWGVVTLLREWRTLVVISVAFVPYFVFHLLFQQTGHRSLRAARSLSLVAWLAARGFALAGRSPSVVAVPFVAAALIVAVPGGVAYGREPHPAFRAIADAVQRGRVQPPAAVYSHYAVRRPLQAADTGTLHDRRAADAVRVARPGGLLAERRGRAGVVSGGPRRTDLALIDPHSRNDVVRYRWDVERAA